MEVRGEKNRENTELNRSRKKEIEIREESGGVEWFSRLNKNHYYIQICTLFVRQYITYLNQVEERRRDEVSLLP